MGVASSQETVNAEGILIIPQSRKRDDYKEVVSNGKPNQVVGTSRASNVNCVSVGLASHGGNL
jgi:hypothetical protein